jgi:hypothetical protein
MLIPSLVFSLKVADNSLPGFPFDFLDAEQ